MNNPAKTEALVKEDDQVGYETSSAIIRSIVDGVTQDSTAIIAYDVANEDTPPEDVFINNLWRGLWGLPEDYKTASVVVNFWDKVLNIYDDTNAK